MIIRKELTLHLIMAILLDGVVSLMVVIMRRGSLESTLAEKMSEACHSLIATVE
ncbi:MAG: hypothetical protein FWF43_01375 [Propionibacteriaceae bacterium]|nr:hypothetical protein [Propionibacteriaceae bacterium]